MIMEQNRPGSTRSDNENNRLKRSFSLTYEDSASQSDAIEARIRTEFQARKSVKLTI